MVVETPGWVPKAPFGPVGPERQRTIGAVMKVAAVGRRCSGSIRGGMGDGRDGSDGRVRSPCRWQTPSAGHSRPLRWQRTALDSRRRAVWQRRERVVCRAYLDASLLRTMAAAHSESGNKSCYPQRPDARTAIYRAPRNHIQTTSCYYICI